MKKLLLLFLLAICVLPVFPQNKNSAYETQRRKINGLLDQRSQKFGQYDESLTMRTGIFGLKTKKDMQRSINILTDIVQTDNAIFKELKILLDYKDLEKTQVQSQAQETEGRINAYMTTIKKLQIENDRLKNQEAAHENENAKQRNTLIAFIIALVIAVVFLFLRKN